MRECAHAQRRRQLSACAVRRVLPVRLLRPRAHATKDATAILRRTASPPSASQAAKLDDANVAGTACAAASTISRFSTAMASVVRTQYAGRDRKALIISNAAAASFDRKKQHPAGEPRLRGRTSRAHLPREVS